ncbi:hypothetical protein Ciccas_001676 [Cichlidogyrus casuarinus]|uniref:Uncharacterized protein n=1 Tax=Cichlidogyrus casuarinus TaxID=1844966 RepID=A0ABD2QJF5_9PLAT
MMAFDFSGNIDHCEMVATLLRYRPVQEMTGLAWDDQGYFPVCHRYFNSILKSVGKTYLDTKCADKCSVFSIVVKSSLFRRNVYPAPSSDPTFKKLAERCSLHINKYSVDDQGYGSMA